MTNPTPQDAERDELRKAIDSLLLEQSYTTNEDGDFVPISWDNSPLPDHAISAIQALYAKRERAARLDELNRRSEANTKLARLLTEIKKETTSALGLTPGEKQVVLMMESRVRRHFQEVERLRIKDRREQLTQDTAKEDTK